MVFHPKIAISRNKDERLCKEPELEGVSSLILDYEAVRMNADGLHLSRLSNGSMESLNHIAKDLKKNVISFRKRRRPNDLKSLMRQPPFVATTGRLTSLPFTAGNPLPPRQTDIPVLHHPGRPLSLAVLHHPRAAPYLPAPLHTNPLIEPTWD